jgi:exopolyphosphatase/guanosine-5'-triphosphate,3'-diphosphate pyrophosphatase
VQHDVQDGIAVAGTATSAAAIAQELDPYDPARVHGYRLSQPVLQEMLARLAAMTEDERRHVPGLHPDRAPTIVPGVILLLEAMRAFGLAEVEVSEHDILRGAALRLATGEF